jgi:TPR repeat protein
VIKDVATSARARLLRGLATPLVALIVLGGCAGVHHPREGTESGRVRWAYFATEQPVWVEGVTREGDLPKPVKEVDLDVAKAVYFVATFNNPRRTLEIDLEIRGPENELARHHWIQKVHPNWAFVGYHYVVPMWLLRMTPGMWTVELSLDGQRVGRYSTLVGDGATLARLRQNRVASTRFMPEAPKPTTDDERQVALFRKTAALGDGRAMAKLGFMYFTGRGGLAKDDAEAVRWFRKGADTGNGYAMALLGTSYLVGIGGLPTDELEAVRWFRKGADEFDGRAMAMLGHMYLAGRGGVRRDEAEAARWFRRGADAGDGRAMSMLGFIYSIGVDGFERNDAEAARWYRQGAEAGDGFGMAALGAMYDKGEGGLTRDDTEAVRWYRKGVDAGSGRAMAELGRMYADGRGGLSKDLDVAVKWYRAGAEIRDAFAMYELGQAYESGLGVPTDPREAARWYRQAASLGLPDAVERLRALGDNP